MNSLRLAVLGLALVLSAPAVAVQPDEILNDPALESRARNLSRELRCMVCQNQSIDDSDAPLAKDLRILVRERLQAGDSDRQVIDYLTDRYGDFVLYRPPLKASTVALWAGPFLILLFGAWLLLRRIRKRPAGEPELSEAERARAAKLLE